MKRSISMALVRKSSASLPVLALSIALASISLVGLRPLRAADWPQWRGPLRNGSSHETGLLKAWPPEGPKLLWQAQDIGDGYSTPAVAGDRLYLLTNKGNDDEFVQAFSMLDGKRVWSTRIGRVGNPGQQPSYPGARSTPTVEGEFLYALGSDGDLVCLRTATGKARWQKNVRAEFGGQPGVWAYAESPLIDGDVLVCAPGGRTATVVALNKQTGDLIWKYAAPGADTAGYGSAVVTEIEGVKQYVLFLQKGVVGLAAATGKPLWRYTRTVDTDYAVNAQTPLAHQGYVYTGSDRGGSLARIRANNGAYEAQEVYFARKLPIALGGAVMVGDYLYGTTNAALLCVDFKTGAIKWEDRSIGAASILYAEGHLYVHGENGQMALVEATPDAYRERGRFAPPNPPERGRSRAWAYPVVANGRLYIRELGMIWCYNIKAQGS